MINKTEILYDRQKCLLFLFMNNIRVEFRINRQYLASDDDILIGSGPSKDKQILAHLGQKSNYKFFSRAAGVLQSWHVEVLS